MGGSSIWIVGRVLEYSFQNMRQWLWFFLFASVSLEEEEEILD
jgi:hypothetical protein